MAFTICEKRQSVIDEQGHALVIGGPGSGKTTLALLKSKGILDTLAPGQSILFLSFSRAAVQQILKRCREILSKEEMKRIDVRTYHSFCWDILHSHGRLLGGQPLKMMAPSEEGTRRTQFEGDWTEESRRLLREEGVVCFDLFAAATAELLERSSHLRSWMGRLFPLVILDEFQDSDDDQWRFVQQLSKVTQTLFLADSEQRIFEGSFRPGVRANRLDILKDTIALCEFDLRDDNFRSGDSDILAVADCVLSGKGPLPKSEDVKALKYEYRNQFAATVHFAVAVTLGTLRKRGIEDPTVAVLARSNDLVAEISDILEVSHSYNGKDLRPIPHEIVWDQELSASAGVAMASALEFVSLKTPAAREAMHTKIEEYFLIKKDFCERYGGRGAQTAGTKAARFGKARAKIAEGKAPTKGSPRTLEETLTAIPALAGDPVRDWKAVRTAFQAHDDLKAIFQDARMVRLFRASDTLATALAGRWIERATYEGAARIVRSVLDQERLMGLERDPKGVVLMTIHKSKGKEFDGVILIEGLYSSPFFLKHEAPQYAPSRRLLRVGITRARNFVLLVRPQNAKPLLDA
ncbi:UvrD-helicase domain-containing protein [Jhaorihella thermophila]|uniref:DNA 3'-5' helicase II n=1 Tax=Jhaorihella thermophila TaxID=488547 RepID=A0A1H5ZE21_9RHOB|nr:ATP-dependent helicase [Jhaorihella thermophila]SEG34521.1 DNA helicase-2 / ATP-dependent DNA helicase PcrA [Jhaorihella thermophila]